MLQILKKYLLSGLLLLISACDQNKPDASQLWLQLRFPARFSPDSLRYQWLLTRFHQLNVHLETGEGEKREVVLGKPFSQRIPLSDVPFPHSRGDRLVIEVKIWDLHREGNPLFRGKKNLSYEDYRRLKPGHAIEVLLHE